MDKQSLIKKLQAGDYKKQQLIDWVNQLELPVNAIGEPIVEEVKSKKIKPVKNKVGDVYMHGAFHHPYILLEKKGESWVCCLMTTEPACNEILEPCRSRFFQTSYITKSFFTDTKPQGTFMGVYDNTRHLKKINLKLKAIFA